jgi:transcriptional regulator with XRE-family HTH domain
MNREFGRVQALLAANVRAKRKELAMSQEELAFEAEIDRTYVSQIERATINPSLLVLCKLAEALRSDLITLVEEQKKSARKG